MYTVEGGKTEKSLHEGVGTKENGEHRKKEGGGEGKQNGRREKGQKMFAPDVGQK